MSGTSDRLTPEEDTSSSPAPLQHGWTFWYIQKVIFAIMSLLYSLLDTLRLVWCSLLWETARNNGRTKYSLWAHLIQCKAFGDYMVIFIVQTISKNLLICSCLSTVSSPCGRTKRTRKEAGGSFGCARDWRATTGNPWFWP